METKQTQDTVMQLRTFSLDEHLGKQTEHMAHKHRFTKPIGNANMLNVE